MIRTVFDAVSVFWTVAPVGFLIGRFLGVWNFHKDILIFAVLMAVCFVVCSIHVFIAFWNYGENKTSS